METCFTFAILLTLATPCLGGYGNWTKCRSNIESLIDTIQNVIKGMEKKPDQIILTGDDVDPCEQLILTNLATLNLTDKPEDPCSRPCTKDDTECFEQQVPLCIKGWSIKCAFQNELNFLIKLVACLGGEFGKAICKLFPGGEAACKMGDAAKKGLKAVTNVVGKVPIIGKRDVRALVKRGAEDGEDGEEEKEMKFWINLSGDDSTLKLGMVLNWTNDDDPTTIQECAFSEKSLGGINFSLEGKTLVGVLGSLLTDTLYLGRLLGLLAQIAFKAVMPPVFRNNEAIKKNICSMTCGD